MIPKILVRTVPEKTTDQVEAWWQEAMALHPDWEHVTYRDPIDRDLFPITSPFWDLCSHGAQKAGLIRLEAIHKHGGVYIDSDVELWGSLNPLIGLSGFAAWEDHRTVPDAVFGAEAGHPAIADCLRAATTLVGLGRGPWDSGPGVFTDILPWRQDFLVLSPDFFYPYHYTQKKNKAVIAKARDGAPWKIGAHHWHHSWG